MTKEVVLGKVKSSKPPKPTLPKEPKEKSFFSTRGKLSEKMADKINLEAAPEMQEEDQTAAAPVVSPTTKKALDLFSILEPTKKVSEVRQSKLSDGRLDPTQLVNSHKNDVLVLVNLPAPISPEQGLLKDGRLDPTKLLRSDPNRTLDPVSESLAKALKR